jgi:hypothetical protein
LPVRLPIFNSDIAFALHRPVQLKGSTRIAEW